MSSYVRYIDRTRDYYLSKGYDKPYQWAHFEDVPFTPLTKPLSESRVALLTTSDIAIQGVDLERDETASVSMGGHYSMPADTPIEKYFSNSQGFDTHATTLEDIGAFFPVARLREAVAAGRIAGLTERFHNVCTAYSQRRTQTQDAPEVLKRCLEDGADVAVLTPVCPVCHQTMSLVARHLEANGIPTVMFATARDIVEHCGVARLVHSDFPLGNPCGEPFNHEQQREVLELGFKLLERAFVPRTTIQTPYVWSEGDKWKDLIFTSDQPFQSKEREQEWLARKEKYRQLKAEGKV